MNRKKTANIIMVAIIAVIAVSGVLGAGYLRGWFDKNAENVASVSQIRGTVNMLRGGLSYAPDNGITLRAGDEISTGNGGRVTVSTGEGYFVLNEKTKVQIVEPELGKLSVEVKEGEGFFVPSAGETVMVAFHGRDTRLTDAVVLLTVRAGTDTLSVFAGSVACGEQVQAGQMLTWLKDGCTVSNMQLKALNKFTLSQIRTANSGRTLCFTAGDIEKLEQDRRQELQDLINSATKPGTPGQPTEPVKPTVPTEPSVPGKPDAPVAPSAPGKPDAPVAPSVPGKPTVPTAPGVPGKPNAPVAPSVPGKPTVPTVPTAPGVPTVPTVPTTPPTQPDVPEETQPDGGKRVCYITIDCKTILDNMDDLKPGKEEFVPEDGIIFPPIPVEFEEGETVFDILKRVCDIYGIPLEYSWTPLYDSYYIEGINHLYEFDCGGQSGWMYEVNNWFPNYGCSSYTVKHGDVIEWHFTCKGLGTDVGAPEWTE